MSPTLGFVSVVEAEGRFCFDSLSPVRDPIDRALFRFGRSFLEGLAVPLLPESVRVRFRAGACSAGEVCGVSSVWALPPIVRRLRTGVVSCDSWGPSTGLSWFILSIP